MTVFKYCYFLFAEINKFSIRSKTITRRYKAILTNILINLAQLAVKSPTLTYLIRPYYPALFVLRQTVGVAGETTVQVIVVVVVMILVVLL